MEGIDVSPDQFPPQYCVPENVSFKVIDMLEDTIIPEMKDRYDVVHLRLWACIIQGNNPSQLIKNVKAMLSRFSLLANFRLFWPDAVFFRTKWVSSMGRYYNGPGRRSQFGDRRNA